MKKTLLLSICFFAFLEWKLPVFLLNTGSFWFPSYHTKWWQGTTASLSRTTRLSYHTIPNDDRELQRIADVFLFACFIIPYQMMTGNYSQRCGRCTARWIIPYQMMTGNYSARMRGTPPLCIIPYQMMTGNYSRDGLKVNRCIIIPYQMMTGNYSGVHSVCDQVASYHTKWWQGTTAPHESTRSMMNHTIPNDDRELQLDERAFPLGFHHTIPNDDRELQRSQLNAHLGDQNYFSYIRLIHLYRRSC